MPDYNKNQLHILSLNNDSLALTKSPWYSNNLSDTSNLYQNYLLNQDLNQGYQNEPRNNSNKNLTPSYTSKSGFNNFVLNPLDNLMLPLETQRSTIEQKKTPRTFI